ncbi:unnamed protein product [Lupinus luteus]|uniref:Pectinesterase catalytic domain-containing protein n=1 Tax=Lupinus luteus TaxID=3873 RepID=A0AAV1VZH3_LUPLU
MACSILPTSLNASRIKFLQAEDVVINNLKDDADKELLNVRYDHNVYINLLKFLFGAGIAAASGPAPRTIVVAKDGNGQFRTVKEAIDAYHKGLQGRYVIFVKAGVYDVYITIPKYAVNILMVGDGHYKTIITGRKNFALAGIKTMHTARFANNAIGTR